MHLRDRGRAEPAGTGKVATPQQAQDVHADIRKWLAKAVSETAAKQTVRTAEERRVDPHSASSTAACVDPLRAYQLTVAKSVNAKNCVELGKQSDIDGASQAARGETLRRAGFLVGGASLKPECVARCRMPS